MGTSEPGDRSSDDRSAGWAGGDPYPPYPGSSYPGSGHPGASHPGDPRSGESYSGYREGMHGEPVPESAWRAPEPTARQPYPAPYGQYPGHYPGQYPPGPYPPYRPTNGMAVASLVLGILWIYWIGSILALVFGYIARQQIRERGEGGDGLAVAGIVLGWIGIGVVALFMLFFLVTGVASGFG